MKNVYKFWLVFIFLTTSCTNKNKSVLESDVQIIPINLSDSKSLNKSFSNSIDNFSYLELKTKSEDYIAEITKVEQFENNYYVLDSKKSNLFVFDNSGNMIRKIGQRGNGPGEYKDIISFAINREKKSISILSRNTIKILEYDLKGKFIQDLSFSSFFPKKMNLINNEYYALYTDYSNDSFKDLVYVDLFGKIVREDFSYPKDIFEMSFDFTGDISKIGNRFLYSRSTGSEIYEIDNKLNIKYIYKFDLGSKAWKDEDKFELERFNAELSKLEMSFLGNNFFINQNVLFFNYTEGSKLKQGFYNIDTKILLTSDSFKKDGLLRLFNNNVGIDKSGRNIIAYTPEYYAEISNYYNDLNNSLSKLDSELFNNFQNADENSNQYLLFFNLTFE